MWPCRRQPAFHRGTGLRLGLSLSQSCPFPAAQPRQAVTSHLHLHIGVREVILWRQFAVVIDEVVQDGWAEDGLQETKGGGGGQGYHDVSSESVGRTLRVARAGHF